CDKTRSHTLHRLFERQAALVPKKVAVIARGRRITYAELNRWSNRVAARLRKLQLGPDSIVGIAFDRSIELLVSILAVWKAECAFLPLDRSHPRERIASVLKDACARAVITSSARTVRVFAEGLPIIE